MAVAEPPEGNSIPQAIGTLYAAIAECALAPSDVARLKLSDASSRLATLGYSEKKLKACFRILNSEFMVNREPSVA